MLKAIELGLFAVSLIIILALIIIGPRERKSAAEGASGSSGVAKSGARHLT